MPTKSGADEAICGFVECTVTRTVITVSRQTTMRELAAQVAALVS
jgi:hypothetical protein